jgi:hypothetical protein
LYIKKKTNEAFNAAASAYLKDNLLALDFSEDYDKDGKSVLRFRVLKQIKQIDIPVKFTSELIL